MTASPCGEVVMSLRLLVKMISTLPPRFEGSRSPCSDKLLPQKDLYEQYSEQVEAADLKSESEVHVFQSLQFLRKVSFVVI